MQLNVLNDLAKAKRRWTEKKNTHSRPHGHKISQGCCIAIAGSREWRQLTPHMRFEVPFLGPKVIEIRLRMCGRPLFQLYMLVASLILDSAWI